MYSIKTIKKVTDYKLVILSRYLPCFNGIKSSGMIVHLKKISKYLKYSIDNFKKDYKFLYLFLLFSIPSCNQTLEPYLNNSTFRISNLKIIYKLSGKWKFTQIDSPQNPNKSNDQIDWEDVNVPGYWLNSGHGNKNIGWYRLNFTISDDFKNKDLGLILKNALNSHELYINGIKVGGVGEIISENEVLKNVRPVVHYISSSILKYNQPNTIAIRIADDAGGGGLASSPLICERELCEREFQLQSMILGGVLFFFLFLGINNIIIYAGNKSDRSYLFFGFSIISFSLVTLGNERYTFSLTENYIVHFYIFHPSVYLCSIFVLYTINYFFEIEIQITSKILIAVYSIMVLLAILSGPYQEFRKIYSSMVFNYQTSILNSLLGLEMIRIILRARKLNKSGNLFILLGALSLIISIFLLTFYLIGKINRVFLNEGFFIMISCFAIAFAIRYKKLREKLFEIEQKNKIDLEIKVREKTKELIEINQKLSNSNSIKDKLFSIISHDLKTPLFALEETLNLFKNKQMNKVSLMKYIKTVNSTLETNKFLLENLLSWSLSQMKDSQLIIEKLDPRPILMEVYALHEAFAISKKVQIKINPLPEIYCYADRNALQLVVRNLISNAIKFTHRNGLVLLDIEKKEKSCNILIQDSGIGMNQETIKTLFQYRREKISLGTNQEGGSGLGLYICKEFLEKMNGKISVESESGKGSRFIIELPLA